MPSHRRLPHVGSPVAFPGPEALGEYVYASGSGYEDHLQDWTRISEPAVEVKFPVEGLVSRRSFIFARAGFGKSNLSKLLFSTLYKSTPTVTKRNGRQVPVGTLIFDPEGEYFWPDDRGRPGLADVPTLEDKLVVFTPRTNPSAFYQSFVAGGVRLDLRRLRPSDVIAIALGPDQQAQQNVRKLRGLNQERWERLVTIIDENGNQTPLPEIKRLLDLETQQEVEAIAARANMTTIVTMLHDRSSQFMDMLFSALKDGKLCVVDVSQMRSGQSLILSGLILRRIFDHNQKRFTEADPQTIPTIAVIEEAQAVLRENAPASEPFVSWVKEGRKYDLGALMITQQPGSIPIEILSQGDNWFVFHLLAGADLGNLKRANAHFSDDLLSVLLNEPIPGHGISWSSVGGTPYPISLRVLSFEKMYPPRDPDYKGAAANTYAVVMRREFEQMLADAGVAPSRVLASAPQGRSTGTDPNTEIADELAEAPDVVAALENKSIEALGTDANLLSQIRDSGVAWGTLKAFLMKQLPDSLEDRDVIAYHLVPKALNKLVGPQGEAWHSFRNAERNNNTYVRTGPDPAS